MNKRIIVIDDDESILHDYTLTLSESDKELASLEEKATFLETQLFQNTAERELLRRETYEITTAPQGEDGYLKIKAAKDSENPYALAFVDIRMPPGWDGLFTAKKIREIDKKIEIVIVTAYSDRERDEIVKAVGDPDKLLYLKKPFDPDEIRQLALAMTQKWNLERETEKQKDNLERLSIAIKHLKTQDLSSSLGGLLAMILHEMLSFINIDQGMIVRPEGKHFIVETSAKDWTQEDIDQTLIQISGNLSEVKEIEIKEGFIIAPLLSQFQSYYAIMPEEREKIAGKTIKLLKLLSDTCTDIINNYRNQEQFLKNERIATIGRIAAGIIHEINNPLSAIIGGIDMYTLSGNKLWTFFDQYQKTLSRVNLPDNVRHQLEALTDQYNPQNLREKMLNKESLILGGVDRLKSIMGNIRSFTKTDEQVELKVQDISNALGSTIRLIQNSLKYKIVIHDNLERPLNANCDLNAIRQVFLNLILNAAQAMQNEGELWVSSCKTDDLLEIAFQDSGPGIPDEVKGRIFEPFYTTKKDGTGLGLSIVKGIVEKHNGTIDVESELNKGSLFRIGLPAVNQSQNG